MEEKTTISNQKEKVMEVLRETGYPKTLISKIDSMLSFYNLALDATGELVFDYCPKCGKYHPHVIKAGVTRKGEKGKQLYRCMECGARFTGTNGGLYERWR